MMAGRCQLGFIGASSGFWAFCPQKLMYYRIIDQTPEMQGIGFTCN
jgi:hypothetical protein